MISCLQVVGRKGRDLIDSCGKEKGKGREEFKRNGRCQGKLVGRGVFIKLERGHAFASWAGAVVSSSGQKIESKVLGL